jgi:hypothetical protein
MPRSTSSCNEREPDDDYPLVTTTKGRTVMVNRIALMFVALFAVFAVAVAPGAFAAGGPASCMGHEASSLSPPGSSDELLGGMPALHDFFVENFPGVPPGQFYAGIAKLHEGSHEACDEALEG